MSWLHVAVLAPFLYAVLVPAFSKYIPRIHTGWFVLPLPIVLFTLFAGKLSQLSSVKEISHTIAWMPSVGIHVSFVLDSLSLLFALIITGMGALVVFYSVYYMSPQREALHNFYIYLLAFMGAMLGVVMSDNVIVLYSFWELTSIASFLLIAFWYERQRSRYGAQKSMLITVLGGFSMLAGFLLLAILADTFSLREMFVMRSSLSGHPLFIPAMVLILLGAFTKSAQYPFHIWLPDAMEAPTPISAYLHSATMVKAGLYLVARFTPLFGGEFVWFCLVTGVGLVTLFWGSLSATRQTDLKALLAYSTISQLGLIMSLLGIGSLAMQANNQAQLMMYATAMFAALFHLVNHSIFKGSLFMVVGIVDHEAGTRDIRRLSGLRKLMPISFIMATIGGLSMAGLPPFSGFLSKEMFFTGLLTAAGGLERWGPLLPFIGWFASVLTFVYSLMLILKPFTGAVQPDRLEKQPREAPWGMLLPPLMLSGLVILLFFVPNVLSHSIFEPAMASILPELLAPGEQFGVHVAPWHGWTTELLMTIGVVVLGWLLYRTLPAWSAIWEYWPDRFSFNNAYDQGLKLGERLSARFTRALMTGFTRDYLIYIFVFFIAVVGIAWLTLHPLRISIPDHAPILGFEAVSAVVMVITAVYLMVTRSRIAVIIALSGLGYMLALLFAVFRAPDLALTQLVVETITTPLYLLTFYFLPRLAKEIERLPLHVTKLLISIGVGVTLSGLALSVLSHRLSPPISSFFERSYDLAGARNMVNAILVDFRGFDTMLEIIVLFTAGLGVYTLVHLRLGRKKS